MVFHMFVHFLVTSNRRNILCTAIPFAELFIIFLYIKNIVPENWTVPKVNARRKYRTKAKVDDPVEIERPPDGKRTVQLKQHCRPESGRPLFSKTVYFLSPKTVQFPRPLETQF